MTVRVVVYWFNMSGVWQPVADATNENDARAQAGPFIGQSNLPMVAWVQDDQTGWHLQQNWS
jgi:hypothetical protein